MGVTHEAGLSPRAPPSEQDPCGGGAAACSGNTLGSHGSQQRGCPAAPSGTETGYCRTTIKTESSSESTCKEKVVSRKSSDMANFMDDLTLNSPKKTENGLRSKRSCDRSSSRSSSRSSCSSQSSSSTSSSASSRSWSRSRSRSRDRRRRSRRHRRCSRSYSRSRSRSRGYTRYRGRYHSRRYRRSPPRHRSRSRSWSRGRSYYRRSYSRSRSRSRGRRSYGFGRTVYPEAYRSWRSRSRTRSRSRSPLHLSEKEKRELLEIAKANAAKALGTENIVLPASLKIRPAAKESSNVKKEHEDSGDSDEQPKGLIEIITKSGMERATARSISFSPNNTMAKPVQQKPASHIVKEPSISPGREDDRKGSPYGQWVPVKREEKKFLNFSPKCTLFRAR
ncbi:arginine/serine-rich protein 1 isoform X1 [Tympanuchus pallidicinctus]|uniref:arginine/serine-rich protein 1 isoform X1 n=1 Tax=Tympanuchus pallidicinctus TaxID=109042 RepID=UPI002286FE0B|nr:arginine/serine-rich protein 1 isoform X1 [Tympanuchus pallidicinctus]